MNRRHLIALAGLAATPGARAHHGWSGFDQQRPIYLEGTARQVMWRNPHAEVELELAPDFKLPADLARRSLPAQSAQVDGAKVLASAVLPARKDTVWEIELAPLTRMDAWKVPELKAGDRLSVVGYAAQGEQGPAVLRAEFLFAGGRVYGLRSSPA